MDYKICKNCVMDSSDPAIIFDKKEFALTAMDIIQKHYQLGKNYYLINKHSRNLKKILNQELLQNILMTVLSD